LSFINYSNREIILKIVYYGPGLGGKTTNIKFIYAATNPDARGKLISLETKQERTLFFDFLPLSLPAIRGFKTRLHLYTVPGQLFYSASRKLIMKGADGVIFVADSQRERVEANLISMEDLVENLGAYGYEITKIPFVIQYNKRDLPNVMPVEDLRAQLNSWGVPDFDSIATAPDGPGVFDTLKAVVKMILIELRKNK
jgi:signal recognition particle receptor subunit beta